eukprot:856172-Pelagomonas_calceolata.AAC.8
MTFNTATPSCTWARTGISQFMDACDAAGNAHLTKSCLQLAETSPNRVCSYPRPHQTLHAAS